MKRGFHFAADNWKMDTDLRKTFAELCRITGIHARAGRWIDMPAGGLVWIQFYVWAGFTVYHIVNKDHTERAALLLQLLWEHGACPKDG